MHSCLSNCIAATIIATLATASPVVDKYHDQRSSSTIVDCLAQHNVPYSISTSANWTALTTPYNLRLPYTPAVVTIPSSPDQVSSSITCAAAYKLKVQPKGGGHSYASYSSGGQDGSLVVDMEKFSAITVDQATKIAKIGTGQRLGNVAVALFNQGGRALPHGTCPGVGIAGHALHGGYGYDSRKWGLTLDHIVAIDVVLANGTQVHATNILYPDIFYAMRGAGDSFGIATYLYLQTEAAPSSVLYFTADLAAALDDINVVTAAFQKIQTLSLTSPLITSNITFGFYTDSGGSLSISGWCMDCNRSVFKSSVFPAILDGFPTSNPSVKKLGWIDALTTLGAPNTLSQPLGSGYTSHDTFYAKSLVVSNSQPLTPAAIKSFWSYIKANQGQGPFFSIINLYGGPTSQINKPSPYSSAYSDRDALWVFQNYGYTANNLPPYNPAITPIVDGLNTAVTGAQPQGNFTAYINYVDPELNPQMAAREYYGASTYDRLVAIKKVVDPTSLFWNPQAIGNAAPF